MFLIVHKTVYFNFLNSDKINDWEDEGRLIQMIFSFSHLEHASFPFLQIL